MGGRICIICVFRKKCTVNKFSEKFLSWLSKSSYANFCFTEIFEGKMNQQLLLKKKYTVNCKFSRPLLICIAFQEKG